LDFLFLTFSVEGEAAKRQDRAAASQLEKCLAQQQRSLETDIGEVLSSAQQPAREEKQ